MCHVSSFVIISQPSIIGNDVKKNSGKLQKYNQQKTSRSKKQKTFRRTKFGMWFVAVPVAVTAVAWFGLLSWKEIGTYVRRIFVFTDTKQKLKALREYDAAYLYVAGGIWIVTVTACLALTVYVDVVTLTWNTVSSAAALVQALEKGELNYTCSFGLSFQAIKCEVFASVNRGLFYLTMQFLKWLQDTFSAAQGINPFKIASSLSLFYYVLASVLRVEVGFVLLRRSVNNAICLFCATVYALHAVHCWSDIVQHVSDEDTTANAFEEDVRSPSIPTHGELTRVERSSRRRQ